MNKQLIREHIERLGIVNKQELMRQTGAAASLLWDPMVRLIEEKEVLFCRLDHGAETLISRHLFLCLYPVRVEPQLSSHAQVLYDWLCDNETATTGAWREFSEKMAPANFWPALRELEETACALPIRICGASGPVKGLDVKQVDELYELVWVTDEYWVKGVSSSARYRDLDYDVSEVRKLLRSHYSTREIDALLYHAAMLP